MSEGENQAQAGRFTVKVAAESHFAWMRTRMAVERTILAWVRTAVSLIAFGFTIVQFFERMQDIPGATPATFPQAPRYLGLALILAGIGSLIVAMWEYRWTINYLWNDDYAPIAGMTTEGRKSPVIAVAVVLLLVGIFAFFSVFLRLI
jgi:putative membrane protein